MREQKKYDEEFRRQTIEYMVESGKSLSQVARETDISISTLSEWKKKFQGSPQVTKKGGAQASEKKQLRESQKRIHDLEEEVAILKKAMAIFTKSPR
jgi:transposase